MHVYELTTRRKQLYLCHAPAIDQLNPFDLVSDKVVACFQCTDVCSVCQVVVVENSVWKLSFVFLSVMRVIMPLNSATHSTLCQNKVLGCVECTDACSVCAVLVAQNSCMQDIL